MRVVAFALFLSLALTGCSIAPTATPAPEQGMALQGKVHGGQQPIVGAHVYLMAGDALTNGVSSDPANPINPTYGGAGIAPSITNASLSLLYNTPYSDALGGYVLTGADGSFSITGHYACYGGMPIYLYVLGGNPGAGTNSAASLMASMGTCPSGTFPSSTFVWINEVSTVAAAYTLAGFASDATHIAANPTNLARTGMANAAANAANLVSLSTGVALTTTPAGNGTVPQTTVNTLANILAACVNSTGPTSAPCSTLFANTPSLTSPAVTPTDTATAAINIAHNPGANVSTLYGLTTPSTAFAPNLSVKPNDFTLAINFSSGGLYSVYIAIDAAGNAWTANVNANSLSKFSSTGAILSPAGGFTGGGLSSPVDVSIDTAGYVWADNKTNPGSISKLSSAGVPVSGSPFTNGVVAGALPLCIDGVGDVWTANSFNSTVSRFTSSGVQVVGSPYSGGGFGAPNAIAADGAGSVWIADFQNTGNNTKFSSTGTGTAITGAGVGYSTGIAIDSLGDAWFTNSNTQNSVSEFSNNGTPLSVSPYTGGGLSSPMSIAIDGAGTPWIVNANGSLTHLSGNGAALSPTTGYTGGGTLGNPITMALDGSGDAWITSYVVNGSLYSVISELIGVAAPVVTPIAAGLPVTPNANGSSLLGTRP